MKTKIILFLHILFFKFCISQDKNNVLPKSISYFSTSNSFTSLGNFASLSTKDNTLNASIYFLSNKESMFTINVKAGASEGISSIFDEGKLNSNVSLGFEYRLLFSSKTESFFEFNIPDIKAIKEEKNKIRDEYNIKRLNLLKRIEHLSNKKIDSNDSKIFKKIEGIRIDAKLHEKNYEDLKKINEALIKYDTMNVAEFESQSEGVKRIVSTLKKHKKDLLSRVTDNVDLVYSEENIKLKKEESEKINTIRKKEKLLKPSFVRLSFVSFGYKATNYNFTRFIDSLNFSEQLVNTNYVSHNIQISYSFISNIKNVESKNKKIVDFDYSNYKFLTLGLDFSLTHNQSSLTQVQVIDEKYSNINQGRQVRSTQNAFLGSYLQDLKQVNFILDYYTFLNKNSNNIALHINPELLIRDNFKPVSSFQFGVLIPFKKKDEEKTILNVEFFYKLKDIFNTTDNPNTLLNTNTIGIQTSFPFNF